MPVIEGEPIMDLIKISAMAANIETSTKQSDTKTPFCGKIISGQSTEI